MSYIRPKDGVTPTWLRQVATALSSKYNVTVREGKGWAMDIEKRVLTYKSEHLLALDRDTCLGLLLHELGHLRFTDNGWVPNAKLQKLPTAELSFNAVNAYEDVRINEFMSRSYGGSRELIDAMNELLAGDSVRDLIEMSRYITSGMRDRYGYSGLHEVKEVLYIAMLKSMGLFPNNLTEPYYDPEKIYIASDIADIAKAEGLTEFKHTGEVYDFIERIVWPRVQKYLPQTAPPNGGDKGLDDSQEGDGQGGSHGSREGDQEGDAQGEGTGAATSTSEAGEENGDATSDGENSEAGDEENGEGDGKPENKSQENQSTEGATQKQDDGNGHGTGTMSGDGASIGQPHNGTWVQDVLKKIENAVKRGRVNPDNDFRTYPFGGCDEPQVMTSTTSQMSWHCDAEQYDSESKGLQAQFANKFATLFRDNQFKREARNQRRGRLDSKALHKFATGKTNLFKRKLDVTKKDYAVSFLLDMSGSMGRDRIQGSFHAFLAFANALQKMQIPYGIGFFGSRCHQAKKLSDKRVTLTDISMSASSVGGSTTAPEALLKAMLGNELARHKAKDKLAVILTDGEWYSGAYEDTVRIAKQNPNMHIYVMGLELPEHQRERIERAMSGHATVIAVDTPEEIVTQYISIAKRHLI